MYISNISYSLYTKNFAIAVAFQLPVILLAEGWACFQQPFLLADGWDSFQEPFLLADGAFKQPFLLAEGWACFQQPFLLAEGWACFQQPILLAGDAFKQPILLADESVPSNSQSHWMTGQLISKPADPIGWISRVCCHLFIFLASEEMVPKPLKQVLIVGRNLYLQSDCVSLFLYSFYPLSQYLAWQIFYTMHFILLEFTAYLCF